MKPTILKFVIFGLHSQVETDGGDPVTISRSFTSTIGTTAQTFNVQLTGGSDDDRLGESIVEYCDNTDGDGEDYNTGRLTFHVRQ